NRNSARLGAQHDVLDVGYLRDQADAANVDRLLADVDRAAPDVDVGIAEGVQDLLQRHAISVELVQIDLDIVRLGRAAPGHNLDHPGNRQQPALNDPILERAQIRQAEVLRPNQLVAIYLADQA